MVIHSDTLFKKDGRTQFLLKREKIYYIVDEVIFTVI